VSRVNQVVYDDGTGRGAAGFASNDFCATPTLVSFDADDASAARISGLGFGDPFSMGIDRTTDVVAAANSCSADMGLYDLSDGTSTLVQLDQNGYYVAVDDVNGLILVAKAVPPGAFDNHVIQSSIAVYRTDGSYVKEIRGVYLWDIGLVPGLDCLQVDPVTRTLWIFGPGAQELEPLSY
jgi:hypothetical protein